MVEQSVRTMELLDCSFDLKEVVELLKPDSDELRDLLRQGLKEYFSEVYVETVECPDLKQPPFLMTGSNFGGELRIAEVGGLGNLYPTVLSNKFFNLKSICEKCDMPNGFVVGPGAGPRHVLGLNSEMVADANFSNSIGSQVATRITKLIDDKKCYESHTIDIPEFSLMANLAISDASVPSKVVRVSVRKRLSNVNFPESVRRVIASHYGSQLVSLAGIFLMKTGKAALHVIPDFPSMNYVWKNEDEIEKKWLKIFEMDSPIICVSVIHSTDKEGLKLRLEHTHCYSYHGDGGHYHYDLSPDTVEYDGYFSAAQMLYRIDVPQA